jgi:hypothetical protein
VTDIVRGAAIAVAAVNLLVGLYGSLRWYRSEPSRSFWIGLRIAQALAVAFAAFAGILIPAGHSASNRLFYLYAGLPIAVSFVAEQLRVISADSVLQAREIPDAQAVGRLPPAEQRGVVLAIIRREMGIMAVSTFVVVFLALRAAGTY